MEEDLDLMHKVLPDPESQGYANIVNTGPWFKKAKQPGADASVQFSAKAGKTPSIAEFTPKDSGERTILAQPLEHLSTRMPGWLGQDDRSDLREQSQVFDRFLVHSLQCINMQSTGQTSLVVTLIILDGPCNWNLSLTVYS